MPNRRDVEQLGLAGLSGNGLNPGPLRWNQPFLDRVSVDAVVDFRQRALETPFQRWSAGLFILEPLKLLDEIELELGAEPGAQLEGDVAVGIGATLPAGFGVQADGARGLDAFLCRQSYLQNSAMSAEFKS